MANKFDMNGPAVEWIRNYALSRLFEYFKPGEYDQAKAVDLLIASGISSRYVSEFLEVDRSIVSGIESQYDRDVLLVSRKKMAIEYKQCGGSAFDLMQILAFGTPEKKTWQQRRREREQRRNTMISEPLTGITPRKFDLPEYVIKDLNHGKYSNSDPGKLPKRI